MFGLRTSVVFSELMHIQYIMYIPSRDMPNTVHDVKSTKEYCMTVENKTYMLTDQVLDYYQVNANLMNIVITNKIILEGWRF